MLKYLIIFLLCSNLLAAKDCIAPGSVYKDSEYFELQKQSPLNGKKVLMYNFLLPATLGASKAFMNHALFLANVYDLKIHIPYIYYSNEENETIPHYGEESEIRIRKNSSIYFHPVTGSKGLDSWLAALQKESEPDLVILYHFNEAPEKPILMYCENNQKPLSVHISLDKISKIDTSVVANFVVVNESKKRELNALFPGKVEKALPPISNDFFKPLSKDEFARVKQLKAEYELEGKKVILCPSRVDPDKGSGDIISIIKEMNKKGAVQDFIFLFIGFNNTRTDGLKKWLLAERIKNRVAFLPVALTPSEMKVYYNLADLAVLPSYYESLGMILLEANSQGIPVIANNVGGIPEVVENDYNGYLIDLKKGATNIKTFSRKIEKLLYDENDYAEKSANGSMIAKRKAYPGYLSLKLGNILENMLNKPQDFIGEADENQQQAFIEFQKDKKSFFNFLKRKPHQLKLSHKGYISKLSDLKEGYCGCFSYHGPVFDHSAVLGKSKAKYSLSEKTLLEIIRVSEIDGNGNHEVVMRIIDVDGKGMFFKSPPRRSWVKVFINKDEKIGFFVQGNTLLPLKNSTKDDS